ncbi:hypothetical protein CP969_22230 [Streptomyces viridosporus T7A]|uniref:Uncharacterized protein n=1 Tax=Streptomyces viridosporus T7A TaxID=665577 RepID=A0ABX6AGV6_STRVD|nr:hypothetical protein CP969_22230 [Streptomyces viridosporus T7A]
MQRQGERREAAGERHTAPPGPPAPARRPTRNAPPAPRGAGGAGERGIGTGQRRVRATSTAQ